ncbi:unnamed protein product, partial [Brachionus calyciflorus]
MNSTPTTTVQNKCTRRRFTNYFKTKVVLFYRKQKELREITSAQNKENNPPNNQEKLSQGSKFEQVYGSICYIARVSGIDRRQIAYWIEHGDEILESTFKKTTFKVKSKTSTCICSPMELKLSDWILEKRESGNSISGFQIKARAIQIYNEFHPNENTETIINDGTSNQVNLTPHCPLPWTEFKASDGWLSKFCTRRGFVLRRVSSCGRELPKDCLNIIFKFYIDLTKTIQDHGFEKGQILNMDESCQYLDAPRAADGKKLPIYLIVPRVTELPNFHVPNNVVLTYRTDSIFNTETIISYIQRIVIPYKIAQNYDKILLIIDSARCHLTLQVESFCSENDIILIFVPPRLTNLLQPADVSWFASLKKGYRRVWNNWYLNDERVFTKQGNAKSPGYAKCIEWLSQLWVDFKSESIVKSFVDCGINTHRINGEKIEIDFNQLHGPLKEMLKKKVTINSYVDNETELEEANSMFTDNEADIFAEDGSTLVQATTTEHTVELNEDDLMSGEEQHIFENLESGELPQTQRQQLSIRETTNLLNLNQIKTPVVAQKGSNIENEVQLVEFQLTPPSASETQYTSNKRKTPENEP